MYTKRIIGGASMRKIFSALLVLVLLTSTLIVSASAAMTATPTSSTVLVSGQF
jgi:hypothetical protein